jgi:hypothetical protein
MSRDSPQGESTMTPTLTADEMAALLEVAALRVQMRALRAEVADLQSRLTTVERADAT